MTQPEKRFKVGACVASVFVNETQTEEGPRQWKTVSLQRIYKDQAGEWKATSNFKVNDIPKAILAMESAYEYLTTEPDAQTGQG